MASDTVEPSVLVNSNIAEEILPGLDPSNLLRDQRRAYDIVTLHLDEWLKGNHTHQLRMLIHGEGGTGRSRVIQTITDYFKSRGIEYLLMKTAYTGIAPCLIGGRTIHSTGKISISGRPMSDSTKSTMAETWKRITYLIVDEISMVPRALLATYSTHITHAKTGSLAASAPFEGINVIICRDFHQFPPVVTKSRSPLYFPNDTSLRDKTDDCMGRVTKSPSGSLTLFNVDVALSRSSGRHTIRLLRDFGEDVLMKALDEHLALEDERLDRLDRETEFRWLTTHR